LRYRANSDCRADETINFSFYSYPKTFICSSPQRVLGIAGPKKAAKAAPVTGKSARYYPADDVSRPKHSRAKKHNAPKIRGSFTPGTVCILLSGRFRGKRVVCLKALESGLLLVSGPYKINGVPLRRVNQAYVIGTSTKVDVSGVDVSKIDDAYFARVSSDSTEGEDEFFANDAAKPAVVSDARKADQKKVDAAILKSVEATPLMKNYLGSKFSLKKHDRPHKMVF
jgi:large subunit ribosomal protein L6e